MLQPEGFCADLPAAVELKHRYIVVEGPIGVGKTALTRALAKRFGATDVIDATKSDPVEAVRALTDGRGADYAFEDGVFSGYDEAKRRYDQTTWMYELGADGYVKTDPTLTNARCVL